VAALVLMTYDSYYATAMEPALDSGSKKRKMQKFKLGKLPSCEKESTKSNSEEDSRALRGDSGDSHKDASTGDSSNESDAAIGGESTNQGDSKVGDVEEDDGRW
jgi:hypothetical protein